jgi:hypothetical protein
MNDLDALFTTIAKRELCIESLETRNMDSSDFHEVAVWSVKAALEAAYQAGLAAGSKSRQARRKGTSR